ncbi:MAG: hypothetical protein IJO63_00960 [Bacilli bacterium]|nr:hypothetical protein [Bacilli bacterium]
MKNFSSLKRRLYKDIFYTILWVIISIPLWLNFDVVASEAKYYENYNYVKYEFLNSASKVINIYDDLEALRKCETQDILVYNDSNTIDNYSLVLKVNKNSNANLDSIKINVNNNIEFLNNYNYYEDVNNYYYVIDSASIVASSQKYVISMWGTNDYNNSQVDYEIVVM